MLKQTILSATLAFAGAAHAQTHQTPPPPTHPTPAAVAPRAGYTVDTTPIETLAADPTARALVVKYFASLFDHPAYAMFKPMPLRAIAPYSQGSITDEALTALQAELDTLH